jgi:hypothetical protein
MVNIYQEILNVHFDENLMGHFVVMMINTIDSVNKLSIRFVDEFDR